MFFLIKKNEMKKNFMKFAGLGLIILVLASSCEKDEKGKLSLSMSSKINLLAPTKSLKLGEVVITDFSISIRDVEFKQDESSLDSLEVQYRGPFELDLLVGGSALSQTVGNINLKDGTYTVLRFKLHKSRDWLPSSKLYDRSIYLAGSIDGNNFEFWHDTSENLDLENSAGIIVSGGIANVDVTFDIDQFLSSLHQIDLTLATDGDEDGLIEINPDDDDGNGDIADLLKENIKMAADLIKD